MIAIIRRLFALIFSSKPTPLVTPEREVRVDIPIMTVPFGGGKEGEDFIRIKAPTRKRFDVSSDFGPRIDPITKKEGFHKGLDLKTPVGVEEHPPEPGEVVAAWFKDDGAGRRVVTLHHRPGFSFYFILEHLSEIRVHVGDIVTRETILGLSGGDPKDPQAGRSDGPHTHIGTRRMDGKDIRPVLDWSDVG